MVAVLIALALISVLIVFSCCKVSGDCAREEEKENAQ
jgi:hypothetical protein